MKELCENYLDAKLKEQAAKMVRLQAEAELIKAMKPKKLEGVETKATDGFKISVSSKLTRKLDYNAYQELKLPENMGFVDLKPAINLKNLRMIERIDPALAAKCITSKPAKPSLKVEGV